MPDTSNYDNENDWMGACVPKMMDEGRDNEQAVAACMSMWNERKSWKGMSFDEIIARFLEAEETKRGARNNRKDQERLQMMHDFSVENGAICKGSKALELDEVLVFSGSEVKALGDGKVAGYLVRFSTAEDTDLTGDYFAPDTDFGAADKTAILYHHGLDQTVKRKKLGEGELRKDDVGIWVEAQLNLRSEYEKAIYDLAKKGKLGWSSGTASHLVERDNDGKILSWPLGLDASLTPTPAEPRNLAVTLKSLITPDTGENGAEPPDASDSKTQPNPATSAGKPAKREKEIFDMDEKEVKAMFDENQNKLTELLAANQKAILEKVTEQAATAAQKAVDEALDKLPEIKTKMNGARIEVTEDPADREFKSIGENCIAITRHVKGIDTHPRLRGLQAKAIAAASADGDQRALEAAYKAALGSNEAIPSQGEFLLEPTITQSLLKPMHETGIFSTKVNRLPVGPNSNSGWIPGVDETSRATGSRWGGVRGYHTSEAGSLVASQPKFRRINWELHKVTVLQYATDELLRDAAQLTAIINQSSAEELDFMVNDDIFRGGGGDRPVGVANAGNLISVPRFTLLQVNWIDLVNMWQRLHPRFKGGAQWYVNSEVMPELDRLAAVSHAGTTEMPPRFVDYDANGVMRIKGKPVVETEYNEALGTAGDILLANMGEYLFWEKGSIEAAMSIHVQFLTDQTAFRFIARYDGQAADASPITPYKGTNTQSPFVTLSASTS